MTIRWASRAFVAVVALAILALVSPRPLSAQTASSEGSRVEPALPVLGRIDLVAQSTWVPPDGDVLLRLDLSQAGPDDRLVVSLHDRLLRRSQIAQTSAGESLRTRLRLISDSTVSDLSRDAAGMAEIRFGIRSGTGDQSRTFLSQAGVYPVSVQLLDPDNEVVGEFVTHIVRLPAQTETQLNLALIQPLVAPPALKPGGTLQISSDTRDLLQEATQVFQRDPAVPVTYLLTPETIRALATSTDPDDAELLAELAVTLGTGTVAASPFVDLDVDALVEAQMGNEIGAQIALGSSVLATELSLNVDTSVWIDQGTLGPAGFGELVQRGVTRMVVPHQSLAGELPDLLVKPFDLTVASGARVTALATDPELQAHAGSTGSPRLDAQHLLADLASIWFERPAYARATTVVLPTGTPDPAFLNPLLNGLSTSPLIEATSVDRAIANADPAAVGGIDATVTQPSDRLALSLTAHSDVANLNNFRAHLARVRAEAHSFSTIFPESGLTRVSYDLQAAVSMARSLKVSERAAYLEGITADIESQTSQVSLPERGAITLPSRDGVIPLSLFNNSGQPARVVLQLDSEKLEFRDGERLEFTLSEPVTPIEIRVRARASGAFPLELALESPDGAIHLSQSRYTVRSTAVSGLGVAISVTATLVLAVWWIRTARRARAAHRGASVTALKE